VEEQLPVPHVLNLSITIVDGEIKHSKTVIRLIAIQIIPDHRGKATHGVHGGNQILEAIAIIAIVLQEVLDLIQEEVAAEVEVRLEAMEVDPAPDHGHQDAVIN
jgi:hypothetical protein